MRKIFLVILVFTFVHLIVSAIEREQFIIDYKVGDVEYKDITVLHCKAHNHFQHYYALVDSDTAVVISLRSQQADTMVGKTVFFPAAGWAYNGVQDLGDDGFYWSCRYDYDIRPDLGYILGFQNKSGLMPYYFNRYIGASVRAVYVGQE